MEIRSVTLAILLALLPALGEGQSGPPPNDAAPNSVLSLPAFRELTAPPSVLRTGIVRDIHGTERTLPVTPELAYTDLRLYQRQLESRYPFSALYYPTDSLRQIAVHRAQEWVRRLHPVPVERRQFLLPMARVAALAAEDSLATSLIDIALADSVTRANPVSRSIILADAMQMLLEPSQPMDRLRRNLSRAQTYLAQLLRLPSHGYRNPSDSTDVLYRKYESLVRGITAAGAVGEPVRVLQFSDALMEMLPTFAHTERVDLVNMAFPYREVALAIMGTAGNRTRLDALDRDLLQLVIPVDSEWPPNPRAIPRERLITQWQAMVRAQMNAFALLGQPAPAVSAHVWLNTSDSIYDSAPRTKLFADGTVRVLAFGGPESMNLPALDRIHRHFPAGVEVVLVTATRGHIGPDLASPADEVEWLREYYERRRGFAMAIAIWAGEKVPGAYGSFRPTPSPVPGRYQVGVLRNACIVIDGQGIIRAFHPLNTRHEEAQLREHITSLLSISQE